MTPAEVAAAAGATAEKLSGIPRAAAKQMAAAWQAPTFSLTTSVDMTWALQARRQAEGATVTDVLVQACGAALLAHPRVNAWYDDLTVHRFPAAHIGIAVATDRGLVVPVIKDVQDKDLAALAAARRETVGRARTGSLGYDDVSGGTFTISNLGMQGIDRFTALLNVPQVAILAVGATTERYVRRGDDAQWRPVADLTLSCDHRAVDGATGAAFLSSLRDALEGTAELAS